MNLHAPTVPRTGSRLRLPPRLALDIGLAVGLFAAALAAFQGATGHHQMADSSYTLLVSERLLTAGTTDLRDRIPADPSLRRAMYCYNPGSDLPVQLIRPPGNPEAVYYGYPLGSSVLSVPFVKLAASRGTSIVGPNGVPNTNAEAALQVRIASRVSAAIVVLFYVVGRFFCPPAAAALVAAGFAFGSPVYSTLARALWSHTWAAFWLSAAILLLVGARRVRVPTWRTDAAFGIGLGTAIFWAGFCRQHLAVSAFAIGVYLLLNHRRVLLFTGLSGGLWAAGLVLMCRAAFGTNLPPSIYSPGVIDGQDMLNRFAWLMVSPSRGLLVFCPYLVVIAGLLAGYRRQLADAGLLLPAGLAITAHTALFAAYNGWHAGSSYGPRYFCDLLPWFALTAVMAVGGLARAAEGGFDRRKRLAVAALAVCFAWGVFVHVRGANSIQAWYWNHRYAAVGYDDAVKEWDHPQFLAGLTFVVNPDGSVTGR